MILDEGASPAEVLENRVGRGCAHDLGQEALPDSVARRDTSSYQVWTEPVSMRMMMMMSRLRVDVVWHLAGSLPEWCGQKSVVETHPIGVESEVPLV